MAIKGGNPLFKVDTQETNEGFKLSMTFPNHEPIEVEFEMPSGTDQIVLRGAMFGIETKARNHLGAVKADQKTEELTFSRAQDLVTAWGEGAWNPGREESDGMPIGGITARAVARVLGKDVATIVAHVRGKFAHIADDKQRAKALKKGWDDLADMDKFAGAIKEIKAEQEAAREERRKARLAAKPQVKVDLLEGIA